MLTTEEFRLLRSLVEWRRANGWAFERSDAGYVQWTGRDGWSVDVYLPGSAEMTVESATRRFGVWYPLRVAAAVDVLVALEVLPVGFSSAFRAGRESAYTEDEWRMCVTENKHHAPEFQFEGVLFKGRDEDEVRKLLAVYRRHEPDVYLQHRRTGATDWERADADA